LCCLGYSTLGKIRLLKYLAIPNPLWHYRKQWKRCMEIRTMKLVFFKSIGVLLTFSKTAKPMFNCFEPWKVCGVNLLFIIPTRLMQENYEMWRGGQDLPAFS
jgi:hypothetical protein